MAIRSRLCSPLVGSPAQLTMEAHQAANQDSEWWIVYFWGGKVMLSEISHDLLKIHYYPWLMVGIDKITRQK